MKSLVTWLWVIGIVISTSLGNELLKNTNFSEKSSNGTIANWQPLWKTRATVNDGILILVNNGQKSGVRQFFRPRPNQIIFFSVDVKNQNSGKIRAYIEYTFEKNGKKIYHSFGAKWKNIQAEKWITLGDTVILPENYKECYLAVMNEKGEKLSIRNPKAEFITKALIQNTNFKYKTGGNKALFWNYRGKSPKSLKYGNNQVQLANGFIIQNKLGLKGGKSYKISYYVRGENGGEFRSYVEWVKKNRDGKNTYKNTGTARFEKIPTEWTKKEYTVNFPLNSVNNYIVFSAKNNKLVEFKDIQIVEVKPFKSLGLAWDLRQNKTLKDGILLFGKTQPALLDGINVEAGKKYVISYDAMTVVEPTDEAYFQIRTKIYPNGIIGSSSATDLLTNNFFQKRQHIFSVPANSTIDKVTFAIRSSSRNGSAKINNLRIDEIKIKPSDFWEINLTKPFYRDAFYDGDNMSSIKGYIKAAKAEKVKLIFQNKITEIPITSEIVKFEIPFNLPIGNYPLSCEFIKNDKVEKTITKTVYRYKKVANTVTIRPDLRLSFNGKVFFPVFQGGANFNRKTFYHLGRLGINTVYTRSLRESDLLAQLDLAHEFGMKLIIYPAAIRTFSKIKRFEQILKNNITDRIKNHPALLAYELPDEPLHCGIPIEVISTMYKIYRNHDPYHPVWLNSAPRNTIAALKPYADSSDIFGVDVYPIPYPNTHSDLSDKTPTSIGKYTQRMKIISSYKRAIFMYLQGFAWNDLKAGSSLKDSRYPTLKETRFMAYDALTNGATGYFLWGLYSIRDIKFLGVAHKIYQEMHQISGLFSNGKQLMDLKTSNAKIRCAVMEYDGKKYYIFLNLTDKTQEATSDAQGRVLLGDGGTFDNGKVKLAGYEALVCSKFSLPTPAYSLPKVDKKLEKFKDVLKEPVIKRNAFINAKPYTGKANWIWYKNGQITQAECFVAKSFNILKKGTEVILKATADDSCIIYLNGEKIAYNNDWKQLKTYDLTNLIKKGKNDLVILGMDAEGAPCAVLAELIVGNKTYLTDTSWKVIPAYKGDKVPKDFTNSAKAVIVAPYGKGAWQSNVKVIGK